MSAQAQTQAGTFAGPGRLIDGKRAAALVRAECRLAVEQARAAGVRAPGLAVVKVGADPASAVYVRNKVNACIDVGIRSMKHELPESASLAEVSGLITRLNADPAVDGILVQLPLPKHLDAKEILARIRMDKDVDGFVVGNVGRLVLGQAALLPCTPSAIIKLLELEGVAVTGKNAVVVGASHIVGTPVSLLLLHKRATVTVCHSRTRSLAEHTRAADILVAAVGRPGMIDASMVKPGAVVIDVGINRLPDGRIVGDVDFEPVRALASAITPVPGGVGPMTVAMLCRNTLQAWQQHVPQGRGAD